MNGMSDVRLMLRGQELQEVGALTIRKNCVAATSRWGVFHHRWVSRKVLLELNAEQLRDIGITWEQARTEGLKPFWRG